MKNMITNDYKIIFTSIALNEIREIYEYISNNLLAKDAAKRLMYEIEEKVQKLKYAPKIHNEILINSELNLKYRKLIIKNYIILYTVNEEKKKVYIAHMYYAGSDYINKLKG